MSTTIQSNQMNISVNRANVQTQSKSTSTFWKDAETHRFAITPIILVVVACMGGIAAAYGIKESVYQLGLITFPAAAVLAMILSLAPMRVITITSVASVLLSLLVILF